MSRTYKFHNPDGLYFISFAVVGWLDVFIRNEYKDLFIERLVFCQKNTVIKQKIDYVHNNSVEARIV